MPAKAGEEKQDMSNLPASKAIWEMPGPEVLDWDDDTVPPDKFAAPSFGLTHRADGKAPCAGRVWAPAWPRSPAWVPKCPRKPSTAPSAAKKRSAAILQSFGILVSAHKLAGRWRHPSESTRAAIAALPRALACDRPALKRGRLTVHSVRPDLWDCRKLTTKAPKP